jgi:hypothetical protein
MPGGLCQNRIYLRVLTGTGIDSGENLTSLPLAICIKNPQNEECTVFCGTFRNYLLSQSADHALILKLSDLPEGLAL